MSPLKASKFILVSFAALAAAGCVSVLPEVEPSMVYRLNSPEPAPRGDGEWVSVQVDLPIAPRGLSGDDIALVQDGRSIAYMANARWISPTPRLVQTKIIETMNAQEPDLASTRPIEGIRSDYELRLDIREFEADYDNGAAAAPLVRVRIGARLIEREGRRLVTSAVFSSQARATDNRAGAIVDAFDRAAEQAAGDLAGWTADRVESD